MIKNSHHNEELHQKISKYYAQINHTPQRKMTRLNTTNIDSRMIPRSTISIISSRELRRGYARKFDNKSSCGHESSISWNTRNIRNVYILKHNIDE